MCCVVLIVVFTQNTFLPILGEPDKHGRQHCLSSSCVSVLRIEQQVYIGQMCVLFFYLFKIYMVLVGMVCCR